LTPLKVAVLTVSDTRDLRSDASGRLIVDELAAAGHELKERALVPDEIARIRALLETWTADPSVEVVITTGGTGITRRDVTLEALAPLVSKAIPGFGELFRMLSYAEIGSSTIQSRAEAALCDTTLVFCLPGSTGAVRLALEKIVIPQLDSRTEPCNFATLLPRIVGEGPAK
jgi:molybdenum cofactor biosynthesis protein B